MESNKFPKSTFTGKIADLSKVDFTKDGVYPVTVEGDLMIHGFTRKISNRAFYLAENHAFARWTRRAPPDWWTRDAS